MPIKTESTIDTNAELATLLHKIRFAPSGIHFSWKFEAEKVYVLNGRGPSMKGWLVNTTFTRPDTNTGVMSDGKSRQEFIPLGASESAVVKTCFLLCRLTAEHEIWEAFTYEGIRPFDPHNGVRELMSLQDGKKSQKQTTAFNKLLKYKTTERPKARRAKG